MRIYTTSGRVPYRQFTFPDGQRHLELQWVPEDPHVTIEARIANADELFDVLLAKDTLTARWKSVSLDVRYLLGARMDRRISPNEPATLQVVAGMLAGAGFRRIRVLDPHSVMALQLLGCEAVYPHGPVDRLLRLGLHDCVVAPDRGATERVQRLVRGQLRIVQGLKHRDMATGKLSGFEVEDASWVKGKHVLIVDDICDGGGTFVGLGEVLRGSGVASVDLFVTHGIFSKGTPLQGIRTIYTTDSYSNQTAAASVPLPGVVTFEVVMGT